MHPIKYKQKRKIFKKLKKKLSRYMRIKHICCTKQFI